MSDEGSPIVAVVLWLAMLALIVAVTFAGQRGWL